MKFPSVTTALAPWSDFSGIPPEVMRAASERGIIVHRACGAIATGLWAPKVPGEYAGYISSFSEWHGKYVEEVVLVEKKLTHPVFQYMGHPDEIARIKGDTGYSLIDYKTPIAESKSWPLQIAAYAALAEANGYKISRVFSLRIRKAGSRPVVSEYTGTLARDFATFLACLQAWRYFKGE